MLLDIIKKEFIYSEYVKYVHTEYTEPILDSSLPPKSSVSFNTKEMFLKPINGMNIEKLVIDYIRKNSKTHKIDKNSTNKDQLLNNYYNDIYYHFKKQNSNIVIVESDRKKFNEESLELSYISNSDIIQSRFVKEDELLIFSTKNNYRDNFILCLGQNDNYAIAEMYENNFFRLKIIDILKERKMKLSLLKK